MAFYPRVAAVTVALAAAMAAAPISTASAAQTAPATVRGCTGNGGPNTSIGYCSARQVAVWINQAPSGCRYGHFRIWDQPSGWHRGADSPDREWCTLLSGNKPNKQWFANTWSNRTCATFYDKGADGRYGQYGGVSCAEY